MNDHKCDMFCLWEDLDSRYKKCSNCIHNKQAIEYPQKNKQRDGMEDDSHLWRNKLSKMNYDQYKKWLERQG